MFVYMIQHDAHRGQVCMLAYQVGFPLPVKINSGLWVREKLWKDCGLARLRGLIMLLLSIWPVTHLAGKMLRTPTASPDRRDARVEREDFRYSHSNLVK
jgi:hypothetical protein